MGELREAPVVAEAAGEEDWQQMCFAVVAAAVPPDRSLKGPAEAVVVEAAVRYHQLKQQQASPECAWPPSPRPTSGSSPIAARPLDQPRHSPHFFHRFHQRQQQHSTAHRPNTFPSPIPADFPNHGPACPGRRAVVHPATTTGRICIPCKCAGPPRGEVDWAVGSYCATRPIK